MTYNRDVTALRELAKLVREVADKPIQEERRRAWSNHNSFSGSYPLIYIRAFAFDEVFDDRKLVCSDPFYRHYEKRLYETLYRDTFGDDFIVEPWINVQAVYDPTPEYRWGVRSELGEKPISGGAAAYTPVIQDEEDFYKLTRPVHRINEAETSRLYEKLSEAVGDILTVNLDRGPMLRMWTGDITTDLAKLRGLEQLMWDAYDHPEFLHKLAGFMSESILAVHRQAREQGDWSLANGENQCMPYANELKRPAPNIYGVSPGELWGYMAAQEFTSFAPEMFDEFILRYQLPIIEQFGLTAFGCCEDVTGWIPYLRKIKNLRRIAVSPFSDTKRCAEQIGGDYILSYRPNPSDMVSRGVDEEYVRGELRRQFDIFKQCGCRFDITLKDVETVSGDPDAVRRFVRFTREEIERIGTL